LGNQAGAGAGTGISVSLPNGYAKQSTRKTCAWPARPGEVRWMRVWDGRNGNSSRNGKACRSPGKPHRQPNGGHHCGQRLQRRVGCGRWRLARAGGSGSSGGGSGRALLGLGRRRLATLPWGTVLIGGIPEVGPVLAVRTAAPVQPRDGRSQRGLPARAARQRGLCHLCVGANYTGGSSFRDTEGIRRINELYLGDSGRYAFNNPQHPRKAPRTTTPRRASGQPLQPTCPAGALQPPAPPVPTPNGFRLDRPRRWRGLDRLQHPKAQVVAFGDRNNNTVCDAAPTPTASCAAWWTPTAACCGACTTAARAINNCSTEVKDYPAGPAWPTTCPGAASNTNTTAKNRLIKVTDVRGNVTPIRTDDAGNPHHQSHRTPKGGQNNSPYNGDTHTLSPSRTGPMAA